MSLWKYVHYSLYVIINMNIFVVKVSSTNARDTNNLTNYSHDFWKKIMRVLKDPLFQSYRRAPYCLKTAPTRYHLSISLSFYEQLLHQIPIIKSCKPKLQEPKSWVKQKKLLVKCWWNWHLRYHKFSGRRVTAGRHLVCRRCSDDDAVDLVGREGALERLGEPGGGAGAGLAWVVAQRTAAGSWWSPEIRMEKC